MIPTSDHNEALVDDELTSISLNYEWRQIIAPMLISGFGKWSASIDDPTERQAFDLRCLALYEDFYNLESPPVLSDPIYIYLCRTTNQTITGGVLDVIDWNLVREQGSEVMWDSDFPSKVTIPVGFAGLYQMFGQIHLPTTATSHSKSIHILVNGNQHTTVNVNTERAHTKHIYHLMPLNEGDELEVQIESPTTFSIVGNSLNLTTFSVVRMPTQE